VSSGKSGRSRSRQEAKERIFDVSNLAELDRGRAVGLASGAPATLIRTLPWYTGPHKDAVEASINDRSAKWCLEWYFQPEAVSRIEAMWRAWEHLRLDGATGTSVWWRDHADHHMRDLLDPRGPFFNCDRSGHRDPARLEPRRAPAGWFPNIKEEPT
jgi:hypothetical protein